LPDGYRTDRTLIVDKGGAGEYGWSRLTSRLARRLATPSPHTVVTTAREPERAAGTSYGQPEVNTLVPYMPIFTWIAGDTDVQYSEDHVNYNGAREVSVIYSKRGWWTTPHQKKRL
jgi:hypothetical protein